MQRDEIKPIHLDGMAAMLAAERTKVCKEKGERDIAFVKRIVCAYLNAAKDLGAHELQNR